jgi:hypothetical protein
MHLVEFDDLNAGGRADGLNGLAIGLDPVIDRHMTAVQESTNGTKTQVFKVKLERSPFNCELCANLVYRASSGCLLLISGLFDAIDEFHAGNDLSQALIAS